MLGYSYNLSLLWSKVLAQHGEKPALFYQEKVITYAELGAMVDRLAETLINYGFCRGEVVAIAHTKKPLSYALMLASLRLGLPYLSIDADSPFNRNIKILEKSTPSLLCFDDLSHSDGMNDLANSVKTQLLYLDEKKLSTSSPKEKMSLQSTMAKKVDGSCIAYIMFTSGSTGTPKGVAVTHDNVLHFIAWTQKYFAVAPGDNFANLSPMYFDNSVFDFYSGLFSGAALTPIPKKVLDSPYDLIPYVSDMKCTIWFSVPSLLMYQMTMKALTLGTLPNIRHIVFGGEGYPKPELLKLFKLFSCNATLTNVYGPTECTCICSAYRITEKDFDEIKGLPPLGELNQNFDYCILDEQGSENHTGELCLIGPNVASGYYNDKALTEKSFTTLSDKKRFMKRMYMTGDIVSRKDGTLWYLGRKDNQIKHMGYRIELEEIENALIQHKDVDQTAVIYERTHSTHGKIIAFVSCPKAVKEESLLNMLKGLLPKYMLPAQIIFLKIIPKNQNGKVDRPSLKYLL